VELIENNIDVANLPALVYSPHPILPAADRKLIYSAFYPRETVIQYLDRHDINLPPQKLVNLYLGGVYIPRKMWAHVRPKPGHLIIIRGYVHGGGGGGKSPLAAIATIAVAIAAPYFAPALGLAAGSLGATLATAGFRLAGTLLIGALFPPSSPSSISDRSQGGGETVSPTYSISGSSNHARLFQPMSLVVGRHKIVPDLGAIPYSVYEGDEQFLYQIFHFGLSNIDISEINVGVTPLTSYSEATYEISVDDTGALTLFPANTEAVAGASIEYNGDWITRTSGLNATALRVELQGQLFAIDQYSNTVPFSSQLQIQYRLVGSITWLAFTGDTDGNLTVENATRKTFRKSYFKSVASGQYEVRVRDVSTYEGNSGTVREVDFTQLLTYQPDTADYTGQKRMAVRIKATGQLNGTIQELNAIASSKIPVWNGSTEITQASSNPAHIYIWLARGKIDADGRRIFGAGLSDSQIDLDGLREWATWCETNNLECNLVFDSHITVNEMLSTVARCGRAAPTWAKGKLGVIYDAKGQPVIQIFGMSNMKENSFNVEYITENLADEIILTFTNPALNWSPDNIRVLVPGVLTPKNSVGVEVMGITNTSQAGREANLIAARQFYHRRRITWEADAEAFICNRGDVVALAHDLTSWAVSGRLADGSTSTDLVLDREITFGSGTPYLTVRAPDNTIETRRIVPALGSVTSISLMTALSFDPSSDTDNIIQDYIWFFEEESTPGKKVKITDINPIDENTIRITAIDETDAYYDSENGDYTYIPPTTYNAALAQVRNITFAEDLLNISGLTRVHISWELIQAFGARLLISLDGSQAVDYGVINGTTYSIIAQGGQRIDVTLSPQSVVVLRDFSIPQTASYTIEGLNTKPADVTGFVVVRNLDELHFSWAANSEVDIANYRLKKGDTWSSSILIADVFGTFYRLNSAKAGQYLIKAVDILGNESVNPSAIILDSTYDVNFVVQHDEQAGGWAGTHNQTHSTNGYLELEHDGVWADSTNTWTSYTDPWGMLPPVFSSGTYITEIIDLGLTINSKVEVDMSVEQLEFGVTWAQFTNTWSTYTAAWAGPDDIISVSVEIDTSADSITWDGFRVYIPGYYNARYIRFKLTLSTSDIIYQPRITVFSVDVDVPDRILRFEDEAINIAGTTITFSPAFNAMPTISVAIQNGAIGDTYKITSKSTSAITINLYNSAGVAKAGVIDLTAIAY
jgi:hypothetical protein